VVTLPFTVKRKNRPSPDNMTLGEHLGELRRRVIICVIALLVGATIAVFAYEPILNFLLHPLCSVEASTRHHTSSGGTSSLLFSSNGTCNLFVTSPLDGLTLRVKIALFGGLVLASPIILFQVWRFVTPGLKASERRYAVPFVLSAFVLFLLGADTAYITLPHALGWLKSVGGPNLQAIYDPIPYLGLILLMMTIFGLTFEFPVVLISLELARVF
jgi:sec-independent protein translocase protein TatC